MGDGFWDKVRVVNVVLAYAVLLVTLVGVVLGGDRDYPRDTFGVLLAVAMLRGWFTPFEVKRG